MSYAPNYFGGTAPSSAALAWYKQRGLPVPDKLLFEMQLAESGYRGLFYWDAIARAGFTPGAATAAGGTTVGNVLAGTRIAEAQAAGAASAPGTSPALAIAGIAAALAAWWWLK